ncbi:MAG: GNAT family N-acetyltransferase [Chloroflexota bacterium]
MPLEIRPAVATDLPRLMGMDHSCMSEYVWQLDLRKEAGQVSANLREVRLPRPVKVHYPRDPFALADEWQRKSMMLVATLPELAGYVCLTTQNSGAVAWVTDLVAASERRRSGIASALLQASEEWALSQGCRILFLETQAKNQPAIRLAQKFGFEFCGYNDHYYASQDVALFFGRMLK